jgi:hypothetical protein
MKEGYKGRVYGFGGRGGSDMVDIVIDAEAMTISCSSSRR